MRFRDSIALALGLVMTTGCYHQVVQTGRNPGPTVVKKPWTATWLWGLVPAGAIDVTRDCPTGIATVQTKMSFMNGVATILTIGIFTPRDVTVTCATGSARGSGMREFIVARTASQDEKAALLAEAIAESARTQQPVLVSIQQ